LDKPPSRCVPTKKYESKGVTRRGSSNFEEVLLSLKVISRIADVAVTRNFPNILVSAMNTIMARFHRELEEELKRRRNKKLFLFSCF
jgi:hypothetical protein